jgi:hypothetical protein
MKLPGLEDFFSSADRVLTYPGQLTFSGSKQEQKDSVSCLPDWSSSPSGSEMHVTKLVVVESPFRAQDDVRSTETQKESFRDEKPHDNMRA